MANTHEFQTIKKKYTAIVDHLAANVDPARFAQKLCEKDLLSGDIVARASVLGVMTTNERIRPVITAVKSRIRLDACKYHTFVDVLQEALPALAAMLTKFFGKFTSHFITKCFTVSYSCTMIQLTERQ